MKEVKPKKCRNPECDNHFKPRLSTDKYCSSECFYKCTKKPEFKAKPKPINKVSDKRKLENIVYKSERIKFLMKPENQICFIDGCNRKATTIEHTRGRIGSLYLDQTYWKPCCLECNLELENNPELSHQYQLSKIHGGSKKG